METQVILEISTHDSELLKILFSHNLSCDQYSDTQGLFFHILCVIYGPQILHVLISYLETIKLKKRVFQPYTTQRQLTF